MRFALVYALMVGLPLLVLVLVLRVGGGLRPPASVGGTWDLALGHPPVVVVQSGPVLELRWGDLAGRGRLRGDEVEGRLGEWTLRARRTPDARLIGTLARGDAAPVLSFVAARAARARGRVEGH